MRILVTGGLGTVGAGLITELRGRGHHVVSCDLHHQPDEVGFSLGTDVEVPIYARCDVGEFRQLERVFDRCGPFDYVYHCAAEFGRWNGEDFYEALWRTNAVGTKNLIRLQEHAGFRLIHFSSSEVYGDWPDLMVESVMDEHEIKQLNDYAMTKWVNEMQIRNCGDAVRDRDRRRASVQHVRPRRVLQSLSFGELPLPLLRPEGHSLDGLPRPLAHVDLPGRYGSDARHIADNFKPGETYNIGGRDMHTIEELSDIILKVTGADAKLVEYKDSEVLTTLLKNVDISKSIRDLDHKNTYGLEEGMRLTADWMRSVYNLPDRARM